ncbi:maltooligosyltrehalose trehalohydrolase [Rhizobium sp. SG_E_25_P2]|uniref:malto-oligosyltrehalose trehalohydrolase n=1 Tax=Rhizobium sp. SG_E_25_P2 TaxID=2879942 RepID=UPI00247530B2|nr:malto-oligosyltrehalose trehalohydrolase [Rhizobium sp. SG_E_25_P2]MDH6268919.1 maltooligosyltrehalose trehalohydrolase [Rhizobium sp. SG_E_25_P2]
MTQEQTTPHRVAPSTPLTEFRMHPHSWGAHYVRAGEVLFRLWAPDVESIALRLNGADQDMTKAGGGWFELLAAGIAAGARYQFVLPDGAVVADPASRAQDGGVYGASIVTDPTAYQWGDTGWMGRPWEEAIFYEIHVGTFTKQGTFRAAIDQLADLADLGITAIEVMPVAEFAGDRGWGYDGVLLYAPHHSYGGPDDFKAFVDAAHRLGMMVFLDCVYNHFGPAGNSLPLYARSFFDAGRDTPWGAGIDFSEKPVRDFFIDNAMYWLTEFNIDGLRLDAVHMIEDQTEAHFLTELATRVHAECIGRKRHLVMEDSSNRTIFLSGDLPVEQRHDAAWNDDFHHAMHAFVTGATTGHFADFAERPFEEMAATLAQGYVRTLEPELIYDGQSMPAPATLAPTAYVHFLQNHDQIGNRSYGDRLRQPEREALYDLLTSIVFLSPQIPMLFMGEDYGETQPFLFFCDHQGEVAREARENRIQEGLAFATLKEGERPDDLIDPNSPDAFLQSKIDWSRRKSPEGVQQLEQIKTLIGLRRRFVMPYLAHIGRGSGRLLAGEDGHLAVDWRLNGAKLQLRANFDDKDARLPAIEGEIFHRYGEGSARGEVLPPLSALFAIKST